MKKRYENPVMASFKRDSHLVPITAGNLEAVYPKRFEDAVRDRLYPEEFLTAEVTVEPGEHSLRAKGFKHVTYYHTDSLWDVEWEREDVPFFDFFIGRKLRPRQ